VIEGRHPPGEASGMIAKATRAYAKRQRTWFNRDPRVRWFDIPPDETPAETAGRMLKHLDALK
jgi:tRNA dimethylallyltransferase